MVNFATAMATLQGYLDSIERIIAMFPATPDAKQEIRYTTTMLKEGVARAYRQRRRMSAWEREYYEPAIHRLFMELQKANLSAEPGTELFEALYSARLELRESIGLLKRSGTTYA